MKKILLYIAVLLIFNNASAQKELWGYRVGLGANYDNYPEVSTQFIGDIIKIPLSYNDDGDPNIPVASLDNRVVYTFDASAIDGRYPTDKLFLASNGKLYGMTKYGPNGYFTPPSGQPFAVLFEYDLETNRYRVVHSFAPLSMLNNIFYKGSNQIAGLIEPTPGLLVGMTQGRQVFKYSIATETTTIIHTFPQFVDGNNQYSPGFATGFTKATDGNLYAVIEFVKLGNTFKQNAFVKCNYITNTCSLINIDNYFDCRQGGTLVEGLPGKLYFSSYQGGVYNSGCTTGCGSLMEYDYNTNTLTSKYNYNIETVGFNASNLQHNGNNKLFGTLYSTHNTNYPNRKGSLFEYDYVTDTFSILKSFTTMYIGYPLPYEVTLKSSEGNYYLSQQLYLQKYVPANGTSPDIGYFVANKLVGYTPGYEFSPPESGISTPGYIEVCRRPSYNYFDTAAYTVCVNQPFTYDVQNTNATSYIWKKNGVALPNQTTGILNIANVVLTDTGSYRCEMVNECGTTITMPLVLTADACLGLDEAIGYKKAISIYPNPTKNILNIKVPEKKNFNIEKLIVTNLLGQEVLTDDKDFLKIDVSKLGKGIYQITLKTDKGDWTEKFVKE